MCLFLYFKTEHPDRCLCTGCRLRSPSAGTFLWLCLTALQPAMKANTIRKAEYQTKHALLNRLYNYSSKSLSHHCLYSGSMPGVWCRDTWTVLCFPHLCIYPGYLTSDGCFVGLRYNWRIVPQDTTESCPGTIPFGENAVQISPNSVSMI